METLLTMSTQELDRVSVMEKLVDRRLTQKQASQLLRVTDRQVRRLLRAYRAQGAAGVISKKRGKPSHRRYPKATRNKVLTVIRDHYADFGPTFVQEKLAEQHGITLSVETLRQWMIEEEIWESRRAHLQRIHQPRPRRDCLGELVQIDGSDHRWFEDRAPRCTLLVYIDDATGRLQELRFTPSENTLDYFYSTQRYIERYGKPVAFYSDKHTVFRVNISGVAQGHEMTQFGRALHALNIDLICANSSQAKGRVERANRTLQDRLVKELRLHGISSIEDGNVFLERFREDFNRRFAKVPANPRDCHRPLAAHEHLADIFCWQELRTVTQRLTVQYDRVVYLLKPTALTRRLMRKTITVYDYPDGTIDLRYEGQSLPFSTFDKVSQVNQAEIVSNKRLGAVLQLAQERQADEGFKRSKKAPKRRGQSIIAAQQRQLNPAAMPSPP